MKFSLVSILSLSLAFAGASSSLATEAVYKDGNGNTIHVKPNGSFIERDLLYREGGPNVSINEPKTNGSIVYPHQQESYQKIDSNMHTLNVGGQTLEFVSAQDQHTASCTNLAGTIGKIIIVNSNDPEQYLETYDRECTQWKLDEKEADYNQKPALK